MENIASYPIQGRLAEERRRLDHVEGGSFGDGPDPADTYDDMREVEDLYDLHDDAYSGSVGSGANDSNWNLGPEKDLYESPADDYGYYRSRKPTSFWKMAVSVTAAVVTGLLFGYMVLSMFNGGNEGEDPASGRLEAMTQLIKHRLTLPGNGASLAPGSTESAVHVPGQIFICFSTVYSARRNGQSRRKGSRRSPVLRLGRFG